MVQFLSLYFAPEFAAKSKIRYNEQFSSDFILHQNLQQNSEMDIEDIFKEF